MSDVLTAEAPAQESKARKRLISLVMPVYNEEANVDRAYAALTAIFEKLPQYDLEFVFTDNHSEDRTFEHLAALAKADRRVKVIRFTRNYGFQRSLLTAYRNAAGDAAIQVDCDLQDPPDLIPQFIALWEKGHDVVVGLRRRREEPALLTLGRRVFYALLDRISDDPLTRDAGDFQPNSSGVGRASSGDKDVTTCNCLFPRWCSHDEADTISGATLHADDFGWGNDVNSVAGKYLE